ncbi:VapB protein of antitoxin of type II toxin-antitoxin system [Mucilaginibacter oryzae]|uniref:VapB protein of antitoxin of type II toxin-antitoxin system n=2 Tax=Mucilaginibacter oryzae TaxID=468058 RepID=A0A316H967_9SPHI|nr:VapB protein of antitoxin of type II toxin-antitoxin system [Mucilaginibacter oryzae]
MGIEIFLVNKFSNEFLKCVYLLKFMCMRTNVDLNDELIAKAQELGNIKTKKAVIEEALKLYVTIENQKKLAELWGKVQLDDKAFE